MGETIIDIVNRASAIMDLIQHAEKRGYRQGWNDAMRRANAPYIRNPTANDYGWY